MATECQQITTSGFMADFPTVLIDAKLIVSVRAILCFRINNLWNGLSFLNVVLVTPAVPILTPTIWL